MPRSRKSRDTSLSATDAAEPITGADAETGGAEPSDKFVWASIEAAGVVIDGESILDCLKALALDEPITTTAVSAEVLPEPTPTPIRRPHKLWVKGHYSSDVSQETVTGGPWKTDAEASKKAVPPCHIFEVTSIPFVLGGR